MSLHDIIFHYDLFDLFFDLFRPRFRNSRAHIREEAIEHLTDQNTLGWIAKNDDYVFNRHSALRKIIDQSILEDIAKNAGDSYVRIAAIDKVTDQAVLAWIAQNDPDRDTKISAIHKLMDQVVLGKIARGEGIIPMLEVRFAALKNLTDQTSLGWIAKNDSAIGIRIFAISKLIDQHLLVFLAKNDERSDVRIAAIEKLTCLNEYQWLNELFTLDYKEKQQVISIVISLLVKNNLLSKLIDLDNVIYQQANAILCQLEKAYSEKKVNFSAEYFRDAWDAVSSGDSFELIYSG